MIFKILCAVIVGAATVIPLLRAFATSITYIPTSRRTLQDASNDGAVLFSSYGSLPGAVWHPKFGWRLFPGLNLWMPAWPKRFSPSGELICGSIGDWYSFVWDRSGRPLFVPRELGPTVRAVADDGTLAAQDARGWPVLMRLDGTREFLPYLWRVHDMSADASAFVGWGIVAGEAATILLRSGNPEFIPKLQGGLAIPYSISADGTTAVGFAQVSWIGADGGYQYQPFRYRDGRTIHLGSLGFGGVASDVSADGSVVVGSSRSSRDREFHAFIWTERTGMLDMNEVFADILGPGVTLRDAIAISPNGRYIVGRVRGVPGHGAYLLDTSDGL
ncbi:MAG: hypothetical protein AB1725_06200 [Armatimonadota bacterium]